MYPDPVFWRWFWSSDLSMLWALSGWREKVVTCRNLIKEGLSLPMLLLDERDSGNEVFGFGYVRTDLIAWNIVLLSWEVIAEGQLENTRQRWAASNNVRFKRCNTVFILLRASSGNLVLFLIDTCLDKTCVVDRVVVACLTRLLNFWVSAGTDDTS